MNRSPPHVPAQRPSSSPASPWVRGRQYLSHGVGVVSSSCVGTVASNRRWMGGVLLGMYWIWTMINNHRRVLSIHINGDDAPTNTDWWLPSLPSHHWQEAPAIPSTATPATTTTTTSNHRHHAPPFPRWKDPHGISWEALQSYITWADQHLDHSRDLLHCPKGIAVCAYDSPNVLYIFGATTTTATRNSPTITAHPSSPPRVWVEGRRRKLVGVGFSKRYPIIEELLDKALQWLLQHYQQQERVNDDVLFPRLFRRLFSSSTAAPLLGIPLILNLGDNMQCFNNNLRRFTTNDKNTTSYYSVPVFTLAVPIDCQFAFPIPHPAALDTAKVYGSQWDIIQHLRSHKYPLANQTKQAVWRGSPTGNSWMRRHKLVLRANTPPDGSDGTKNNTTTNNATMPIFDVGFGKHYHKIVPSYRGPRIGRKDKIFFEDFAKYAIVLDADGSSWSERFPCLLCLRTVVAKLRPDYVDWLWPTVQSNKHFVEIQADSSNLWTLVEELLSNDIRRIQILETTVRWCQTHMTYHAMIMSLLQSLEFYVEQLDVGDPNWSHQWQQLLLHNMPAKHHHWQPLPMQTPKAYFALWRDINNLTANDPYKD